MSALAPLDSGARHRLLALMGIDVYTRRAPAQARVAQAAAAAPVQARSAAASSPAVLAIACDLVEAGSAPLAGRHGALLRQILAAVGVTPADTRFVEPGSDVTTPCIGFHDGVTGDTLRAPPLAHLRESAAAKRALWRGLRPLRRKLGQG